MAARIVFYKVGVDQPKELSKTQITSEFVPDIGDTVVLKDNPVYPDSWEVASKRFVYQRTDVEIHIALKPFGRYGTDEEDAGTKEEVASVPNVGVATNKR